MGLTKCCQKCFKAVCKLIVLGAGFVLYIQMVDALDDPFTYSWRLQNTKFEVIQS